MNEQIQPPKGTPLFNPWTPEFIADPYPFYHRLRVTDPMHLTPLGLYVASRHADVSEILRDKRFGKDFIGRMTRRSGPQILQEPVYRSMSHWMLQLDPPDHGRLRGLVVRAFTARRIEDMRPRIQQIVDEIIDHVEPRGRMDLIADFAFRLSVTVISGMLGIPRRTGRSSLPARAPPVVCSTWHRSATLKLRSKTPITWLWRRISSGYSSCGGGNPAMI